MRSVICVGSTLSSVSRVARGDGDLGGVAEEEVAEHRGVGFVDPRRGTGDADGAAGEAAAVEHGRRHAAHPFLVLLPIEA
jgi:hypothetical protein